MSFPNNTILCVKESRDENQIKSQRPYQVYSYIVNNNNNKNIARRGEVITMCHKLIWNLNAIKFHKHFWKLKIYNINSDSILIYINIFLLTTANILIIIVFTISNPGIMVAKGIEHLQ